MCVDSTILFQDSPILTKTVLQDPQGLHPRASLLVWNLPGRWTVSESNMCHVVRWIYFTSHIWYYLCSHCGFQWDSIDIWCDHFVSQNVSKLIPMSCLVICDTMMSIYLIIILLDAQYFDLDFSYYISYWIHCVACFTARSLFTLNLTGSSLSIVAVVLQWYLLAHSSFWSWWSHNKT